MNTADAAETDAIRSKQVPPFSGTICMIDSIDTDRSQDISSFFETYDTMKREIARFEWCS